MSFTKMATVTVFIVMVLFLATEGARISNNTTDGCRNVIYNVDNLTQQKSDTEVLGTFLSNVVDKVYRLENEMKEQQEKLVKLEKELAEERKRNVPSVGFHVLLTQTFSTKPAVVPFNKVVSNYGSGWNNITHNFVAPHAGMYLFYMSFLNARINTWAEIRRGSTRVSRAYTQGGGLNAASCSTVLLLQKGEHISVWLHEGQLHDNSWAHFVGTLIHT